MLSPLCRHITQSEVPCLQYRYYIRPSFPKKRHTWFALYWFVVWLFSYCSFSIFDHFRHLPYYFFAFVLFLLIWSLQRCSQRSFQLFLFYLLFRTTVRIRHRRKKFLLFLHTAGYLISSSLAPEPLSSSASSLIHRPRQFRRVFIVSVDRHIIPSSDQKLFRRVSLPTEPTLFSILIIINLCTCTSSKYKRYTNYR